MSAERTREVARFFGLFMLAAQLRLLYKLLVAMSADYDNISHVTLADILENMSWLRPPMWSATWLHLYLFAFLFVAVVSGCAIWVLALRRWRLEASRHD